MILDYYPFGEYLTNRNFSRNKYPNSFNGKRDDGEMFGWQDYGFRNYMKAARRFDRVDPLYQEYSYLSTYQFGSNMPTVAKDIDGLEADIKFEYAKSNQFVGNGMDEEDKKIYQESFDNIVTPFATSILVGPIIGKAFQGVGYLYKAYKTENAIVKVSKAKQVLQNAEKGANFEKEGIKKLSETQDNVVEQITVKSNKSGVKTRLDAVGTDKATGKVKLTDFKSSSTAPLTKNQKIGYPEIEEAGGIIMGKGKPPYVGGTEIPPTLVDIIKPK
ncbi:MAG: hypothetical protein J0M08_11985 [Bacteroidetes bacterium]|nr:hypothetical protein [Bacteroidota bacterium]